MKINFIILKAFNLKNQLYINKSIKINIKVGQLKKQKKSILKENNWFKKLLYFIIVIELQEIIKSESYTKFRILLRIIR